MIPLRNAQQCHPTLTQTLVSGISTYTFTLLSAQTQAAGALTHNLFLTGSVQGDTSPNFSA